MRSPANAKRRSRRDAMSSTPNRSNLIGWWQPFPAVPPATNDGVDPTDDEYPDKPALMRWATYNRLLDKLRAADGVADERLRRVLINAQMSGFGSEVEIL